MDALEKSLGRFFDVLTRSIADDVAERLRRASEDYALTESAFDVSAFDVSHADTQTVHHCGDCPFLMRDDGSGDPDLCSHPLPERSELPDDHTPPGWCPLRARPTVVVLDGGKLAGDDKNNPDDAVFGGPEGFTDPKYDVEVKMAPVAGETCDCQVTDHGCVPCAIHGFCHLCVEERLRSGLQEAGMALDMALASSARPDIRARIEQAQARIAEALRRAGE